MRAALIYLNGKMMGQYVVFYFCSLHRDYTNFKNSVQLSGTTCFEFSESRTGGLEIGPDIIAFMCSKRI